MRRSDVPPTLVACAVAIAASAFVASSGAGCVVALDDEFDGGARDAGGASDAAPLARTCLPFHAQANIAALSGGARSVPFGASESLWWFDSARVAGVSMTNAGFVADGTRMAPDCAFAGALAGNVVRSIAGVWPRDPNDIVALLDVVATPNDYVAYYALYEPAPGEPFGVRAAGFGVARRDSSAAPAPGVFQPTASLLWASDRPSYGSAAIATNDFVYVYGCKSAGAFAQDCFVARAPLSSDLASPSSYAYDADGTWSANADDARPVARGGPSLSVKWRASAARWVMTYVPPLGRDIRMRSAVDPEGPWSAEITLARCDLAGADPDAFCAGAQQHPELRSSDARALVVSYGVQSFKVDASLPPEAYWPRLAELALPDPLP